VEYLSTLGTLFLCKQSFVLVVFVVSGAYNYGVFSSSFRENGKIVSVEAEPNLLDKDYKKTVKLTWLAETESAPFVPCICVYFDHIISKSVLAKDENFKDYIGHNTRVLTFI
jgi:bifunctional glutamyl/prolyl-tRNA synthetase